MKPSINKVLISAVAVIFVFALAPLAGAADGPLVLRDMVEEARANNPEIKALKEKLKAMQARTSAQGSLDDPTLRVEMEDLSRSKPFNNGPGNAMQTRYTLSQMFPFPGKRPLKEKIAEKEALISGAELGAKAVDIIAMVKEAYYAYAFLGESVKINAEVKELLSYVSRIAESRYSAGQGFQQDVIKAQFEAAMLTNELITLEAEKESAAAALNALLGRPEGSFLGDAPTVKLEKADFSAAEIGRAAAVANPQIKAVEYEIQANELAVDMAKKNYYPDLMVGVAPIQRDGRFDAYDLMFQINIPIWTGKYDYQTKEAVANAGAARLKLAAERNKKALEIKDALLKAEAAYKVAVLYETSLMPQAEMSFESSLKSYQSGKSDFLTLLDTGRALKKIKLERIGSVIDYMKKLAILEKAAGVELGAKEGAR